MLTSCLSKHSRGLSAILLAPHTCQAQLRGAATIPAARAKIFSYISLGLCFHDQREFIFNPTKTDDRY